MQISGGVFWSSSHRWNRVIIKTQDRETLNRYPLEFYGSLEGPPHLHTFTLPLFLQVSGFMYY